MPKLTYKVLNLISITLLLLILSLYITIYYLGIVLDLSNIIILMLGFSVSFIIIVSGLGHILMLDVEKPKGLFYKNVSIIHLERRGGKTTLLQQLITKHIISGEGQIIIIGANCQGVNSLLEGINYHLRLDNYYKYKTLVYKDWGLKGIIESVGDRKVTIYFDDMDLLEPYELQLLLEYIIGDKNIQLFGCATPNKIKEN